MFQSQSRGTLESLPPRHTRRTIATNYKPLMEYLRPETPDDSRSCVHGLIRRETLGPSFDAWQWRNKTEGEDRAKYHANTNVHGPLSTDAPAPLLGSKTLSSEQRPTQFILFLTDKRHPVAWITHLHRAITPKTSMKIGQAGAILVFGSFASRCREPHDGTRPVAFTFVLARLSRNMKSFSTRASLNLSHTFFDGASDERMTNSNNQTGWRQATLHEVQRYRRRCVIGDGITSGRIEIQLRRVEHWGANRLLESTASIIATLSRDSQQTIGRDGTSLSAWSGHGADTRVQHTVGIALVIWGVE